MSNTEQNKIIKNFLFTTIWHFKFWIGANLLVAIVWAVDLSLRPYLLKIITDQINKFSAVDAIKSLQTPIICYLLLSFAMILMFRLYDYLWLNLNPRLKRYTGNILMEKMMNHSLSTYQDNLSGNLATKIKDVMSGIPDLLRIVYAEFLPKILAIFFAIITAYTVDYKFALLLFVWISIFIAGSLLFIKKARKLCEYAADIRSQVVGQMVDILSNMLSIRLFAGKKYELNNFNVYLDKYVQADQRRDWWFLFIFAFQGFSFIAYQTLVFLLLLSGFKAGYVSAGDFVLLLSINLAIINSLWSLSKDMLSFAELISNIIQGLSIALLQPEISNKVDAKELQVTTGKITFERVNFGYKNTSKLFEDQHVNILPGQKIGLVGYSGGGKTTFINLILRLYDISEGQIKIDNQNISDVDIYSLHKSIAVIPQDPQLFHRTIMENIRYGRFDATDQEVFDAAKKAKADQFIHNLAEGYNTMVGERGIKLSGGQRQRIALARAILKNAPILILDEATSQLDSITETEIQDSLWEIMKNKTTLIIAHRLSTLLNMDRIMVFEKGQIVEDGTHKELLTKKGLYKTLWDSQIGGFLPQ